MAVNDWLELSGRLSRSFDNKPETGVQRGLVKQKQQCLPEGRHQDQLPKQEWWSWKLEEESELILQADFKVEENRCHKDGMAVGDSQQLSQRWEGSWRQLVAVVQMGIAISEKCVFNKTKMEVEKLAEVKPEKVGYE